MGRRPAGAALLHRIRPVVLRRSLAASTAPTAVYSRPFRRTGAVTLLVLLDLLPLICAFLTRQTLSPVGWSVLWVLPTVVAAAAHRRLFVIQAALAVLATATTCVLGAARHGATAISASIAFATVAGAVVGAAVIARRLSRDTEVGLAALRTAARTDRLTGALNRRGLEEAFLRLADRSDGSVALIAVDLDGLKSINDRHGHAAGDRAIVETVTRMRGAVGPDGLVARIGGDEMIAVVAGATAPFATVSAALAETPPLAASVGAATATDCSSLMDLHALIVAADADLYRIKSERRGRVEAASAGAARASTGAPTEPGGTPFTAGDAAAPAPSAPAGTDHSRPDAQEIGEPDPVPGTTEPLPPRHVTPLGDRVRYAGLAAWFGAIGIVGTLVRPDGQVQGTSPVVIGVALLFDALLVGFLLRPGPVRTTITPAVWVSLVILSLISATRETTADASVGTAIWVLPVLLIARYLGPRTNIAIYAYLVLLQIGVDIVRPPTQSMIVVLHLVQAAAVIATGAWFGRLCRSDARSRRILAELAVTDPLTGMSNRRGLDATVSGWDPSAPVDVMILDVDNFKLVNDRNGHHGGDRCLAGLALILRRSVPPGAVIARVGGDEFVVVSREPLPDGLMTEVAVDLDALPAPITVSHGVAHGRAGDLWDLVLLADSGLMAGRRRTRPVVDEVLPEPH
ncbi:diguanylate cyclase [Nakamurella sp. YIM 132087]|uniref:Diguanylate cyclase n=1 Tax=Nakamurella alba TaxID=2665158 RepID=A0A7K1FEW7_9ACTN|nr:GGDEF domain-containing protein [Nakamurella alba]MTD12638.1 diguanylate cyclase [Nakamurella alba]